MGTEQCKCQVDKEREMWDMLGKEESSIYCSERTGWSCKEKETIVRHDLYPLSLMWFLSDEAVAGHGGPIQGPKVISAWPWQSPQFLQTLNDNVNT